jgi:hypothetical protein
MSDAKKMAAAMMIMMMLVSMRRMVVSGRRKKNASRNREKGRMGEWEVLLLNVQMRVPKKTGGITKAK